MPAANGSGKDLVVIAAFAVWFALKGLRNFVFITSASHEQIKTQTNPHIRDLCTKANKKFGTIFRSVENYHVCTQTASEIKLYVTDEPGRAEGYHPRFGGEMALIFNEAKSIPEELWTAYARCTGYSYWLEISSPGGKQGHFYGSSRTAISYPRLPELGQYFLRHVTAYDCPHIPRSHIERQIAEQSKEWVDSSINALFTDYGENTIVKLDELWLPNRGIIPEYQTSSSYGLGGDLAAGGDECSFYLRKGPKIVDELHFRQSDTTITAEIVDAKFGYIKDEPDLVNRMDDGGVGHAIIDNLVKMGWQIQRVHNQSAANNKREFINRGAEMYFHLARLLKLKLIAPHATDPILTRQVTSRLADNINGGKFRLEKKEDHRRRTKDSPDRADAYVLCYSSYPIVLRKNNDPAPKPALQSLKDFEEAFTWGGLIHNNYARRNNSRPTFLRRV